MIHVGEFLDYACNQLGEDRDDALVQDLLYDWVNEVKDEIVTFHRWRWLEGWGSVTVPSSGAVYFPDYVDEVLSLYPSSLGYRRPTEQIGGRVFDDAGASVSSGMADYDVPWGYYGVQADHDAAAAITVTSSAAGGDQNMQVTIEGINNTLVGTLRYDLSETVTLGAIGTATTTGTFASGVDGVRDVYIVNSSRTGLSQGVLTVTSASGQVLVRLDSSRELRKTFLRSEIYPASSGTMTFRFYRRVPDVYSEDAVLRIPRELKSAFTAGMMWKMRDLQGNMGEAMMYYARMVDKCKQYVVREERRPGRRRGIRANQAYRYHGWRL